ncbi:hypothetical protein NDA11_007609 [Ustilago hordei]|uniref:Uncharacterized protein n=1 Tax=Ustilago hordei TaxID=120017 RepID=I2FVS1_USTHO|nr:hypothetical protein NDA10_002997 [Ustilago hordei]KAJ1578056.1 hypothetical protein NDA12_003181 [Ustilago hordei]KAJ1578464.1 hypothetical protein NDA11_007609 [Ustilago hordei]KAJ1592394.1 hypothetical protein NDA15_001401 [Ustilago hordei]KAJ1595915.1 hypothetical protein NDA14_006873 [Ustilago hordei]
MSSLPSSHPPSSSSSKAQLSELEIQIDNLLPPSLDGNQNVSTSSPLALDVSALLQDGLTSRFERTKWPLDRIHKFLDSFFKSHPYLHHRHPQSEQVAAPTTPVKPTSALPQQALNNTPRTSKATGHLAQLGRVDGWNSLTSKHESVCKTYGVDGFCDDDGLSALSKRLIQHKPQLCAIIPELNNVFSVNIDVVYKRRATKRIAIAMMLRATKYKAMRSIYISLPMTSVCVCGMK